MASKTFDCKKVVVWNQEETKWDIACKYSTIFIYKNSNNKNMIHIQNENGTVLHHIIPDNSHGNNPDFKTNDSKLSCLWFVNNDQIRTRATKFHCGVYFKSKSVYRSFTNQFKKLSDLKSNKSTQEPTSPEQQPKPKVAISDAKAKYNLPAISSQSQQNEQNNTGIENDEEKFIKATDVNGQLAKEASKMYHDNLNPPNDYISIQQEKSVNINQMDAVNANDDAKGDLDDNDSKLESLQDIVSQLAADGHETSGKGTNCVSDTEIPIRDEMESDDDEVDAFHAQYKHKWIEVCTETRSSYTNIRSYLIRIHSINRKSDQTMTDPISKRKEMKRYSFSEIDRSNIIYLIVAFYLGCCDNHW